MVFRSICGLEHKRLSMNMKRERIQGENEDEEEI